jgi:hypothetical protein
MEKNFVVFTLGKLGSNLKFYQNPDPHTIRIRIRPKCWIRIRIRIHSIRIRNTGQDILSRDIKLLRFYHEQPRTGIF